jgi:pimeloyl-ACP methyl ester carboxylesterase
VRSLVLAVLALAAASCGPPINVRRVAPERVTAELARSVLNSRRPSLFTENVLYRWNLERQWKEHPEAALATLRERILAEPTGRSAVFALAELCFAHAVRTDRREYYLAASLYAYAFLFPGARDEPLEKLDPRARVATDLYNRALTDAFASRDRSHVELQSGTYPLPFGQQLVVRLDPAHLQWANRRLVNFIPVGELEVTGLGARYRQAGIGAPLAAEMEPIDPDKADFLAKNAKAPVTALLRVGDARAQLAQPMIDGELQIFNAYETRSVVIDDRPVPLEVEPSAALAYGLSRSNVWAWELRGFLAGDLFGREKIEHPLAFVEPYRPGRIPVVFVHGTASSPGRWADMLNVLSNTRILRDRYQYWFFFYETGNPITYSALKLRETLTWALDTLDPDGRDPALRQMVVIGHSQGGLLTKMTAIDSGNVLWDAFSRRPLEELKVSAETRDLLRRTRFITPLPFVREVIFISTPHYGSYVAGWSLSHWVSGFAKLPRTLLGMTTEMLQGNRDALLYDPTQAAFGAISNMTPGSRFIEALAAIPIVPGVGAHSIIAVTGDLPPDGQGDGVVKYQSAHITGVDSELVVPHQSHSAQSNPVAIEEVRRILFAHAESVCAAERVACAQAAAPVVEEREPRDGARD